MDEPILEIHAPQDQEEDHMEEKSTTSTENLETPPVTPTLDFEFNSDIDAESSLDSNRNSDSEQKKSDSQVQQVQNIIPTITDPSTNLTFPQLQIVSSSSSTAVSTTASPQERSRFLRSVPTPANYREGIDRKKSCASAALALFPQVPPQTRHILLEGMVDFILDFSYETWHAELQEAIISFHDYNVDMKQALSAFQIRPNRSKRFVPTGDHAHSRISQSYPTADPPAQPTASSREPLLMTPEFRPAGQWRMESSNNIKLEIITELTHRNVSIQKLEYILDLLTQN